MFAAPPEQNFEWTNSIVNSAKRFLTRVLNLYQNLEFNEEFEDKKLLSFVHKKIKEVREDISKFKFNTVIAKLMEFLNFLEDYERKKTVQYKFALKIFSILLAPFAPHISEEIYHKLGYENSVFENRFPDYDENYIIEEEVEIPVQINGKFRGVIKVPINSDEEKAFEILKNSEIYEKYLNGRNIVIRIFVLN